MTNQEAISKTVELKPCPFRIHGERKAAYMIPGEYYYNETFMPCLKWECPCYHEDAGDTWCNRNGTYIKLNGRANNG